MPDTTFLLHPAQEAILLFSLEALQILRLFVLSFLAGVLFTRWHLETCSSVAVSSRTTRRRTEWSMIDQEWGVWIDIKVPTMLPFLVVL